MVVVVVLGGGPQIDTSCAVDRYQKLWKSYVKLRHLLANSPKVKQIDKQKLMQREVGTRRWGVTARSSRCWRS